MSTYLDVVTRYGSLQSLSRWIVLVVSDMDIVTIERNLAYNEIH